MITETNYFGSPEDCHARECAEMFELMARHRIDVTFYFMQGTGEIKWRSSILVDGRLQEWTHHDTPLAAVKAAASNVIARSL